MKGDAVYKKTFNAMLAHLADLTPGDALQSENGL